MTTAPAQKRLALLQFGNPDGSARAVDYARYGLERVVMCAEDETRDPALHAERAVAMAADLPRGSLLAVNCERYGDKNVEAACEVVAAVTKRAPQVSTTAYVPEATVPFWDAVGNGKRARLTAVARAVETVKRLAGCGQTLASIDAYARLGAGGLPIKHWASSSWFDSWCVAVGEAGAVVEPFCQPVLWLANRVIANGVTIPAGGLEPYIDTAAFQKMLMFAEARGWASLSLLGWSDTLKDRTGRGFAPMQARDEVALLTLKNTPAPTA